MGESKPTSTPQVLDINDNGLETFIGGFLLVKLVFLRGLHHESHAHCHNGEEEEQQRQKHHVMEKLRRIVE